MVKISIEEKEQIKITNDFKDKVMDSYNTTLFVTDKCKEIYDSEQTTLYKFVANKLNINITIEKPEEIKHVEQSKDFINITKSLKVKDYEAIFPKTIEYIKSSIFHGNDSKYYVLNKDIRGHILPKEYSKQEFNSLYADYFEPNMYYISRWFKAYSKLFVLTIDNLQPRVFIKNDTSFLNLFQGYKYDKRGPRDLERIKKGQKGVDFIFNHIKHIWNSDNEQNFQYDYKWICKLISGYKLKTMIYLKGKQGRGKTCICQFLMKVLGEHITLTLSSDQCFTSDFNAPLMGMSLVLLDEIVHDYNGTKSVYNKIKPYITDDTMAYRNLYEKLKVLINLSSFIMAGNMDMLKLDSNGDDRRLKVNDILDEVKDLEYCKTLDNYIDDVDVQYSFFWHCVDNNDPNFQELAELKKLPMSETKKNMIVKSLDSCTLFLKDSINNEFIMSKYIKPKDLYFQYVEFAKLDSVNKNYLSKESFLEKIKQFDKFITFKNKKLNGANPTTYVFIDRIKLIEEFNKLHYFNEYDNIDDNIDDVLEEVDNNDKVLEENIQLKKEIDELKKLLEQYKNNVVKQPEIIVKPVIVDDSDEELEAQLIKSIQEPIKIKINKSLKTKQNKNVLQSKEDEEFQNILESENLFLL
jgi:hypothetical protein